MQPTDEPLVSFHDVGKTYRSLQGVDYAAVEHFSVEIEAGEFFCLLGPSGVREPRRTALCVSSPGA